MSAKAAAGQIVVVDDFSFEAIKTRPVADMLKNLGLAEKKTLLMMPHHDNVVSTSGRNIEKLNVMVADQASTYDILNSQVVLFQKGALQKIEETLG